LVNWRRIAGPNVVDAYTSHLRNRLPSAINELVGAGCSGDEVGGPIVTSTLTPPNESEEKCFCSSGSVARHQGTVGTGAGALIGGSGVTVTVVVGPTGVVVTGAGDAVMTGALPIVSVP